MHLYVSVYFICPGIYLVTRPSYDGACIRSVQPEFDAREFGSHGAVLSVYGAMFTVPVPRLVILALKLALVPVALVNEPFTAIALVDAEVVKLCEEDAHTPLDSAELLARSR